MHVHFPCCKNYLITTKYFTELIQVNALNHLGYQTLRLFPVFSVTNNPALRIVTYRAVFSS